MVPQLYLQSVVERNVVMRLIPYTDEVKRSHIEATRSLQPVPKTKNVWSLTFTSTTRILGIEFINTNQ